MHEVQGGLPLNVVVEQSGSWKMIRWVVQCAVQLLPTVDETLPLWGDALLVLNLSLHNFNGVGGIHFKSDGLAIQIRHKYLVVRCWYVIQMLMMSANVK